MTEDEAKTKWCPFARAQMFDVAVNRNGFGAPYGITLCVGSACMAWRWAAISQHSVREYATRELVEAYIEGLKEYEPPTLPQVGGYCGLAGRP